MSDQEQLPSWVGRSVPTPPPAPDQPPVQEPLPPPKSPEQPLELQSDQERKQFGRTILIVVGVAAVGILLSVGGYYVGTLDRDEIETDGESVSSATTTTGTTIPAAPTADNVASDADSSVDTAASVEAKPDDVASPPTTAAPDSVDGTNPNGGLAPRRATLRGGKVYLEGALPSREIADAIVEKVVGVAGPNNVIDNYIIDPSVVFDPSEKAPVYVEEVVLFEFNESTVSEQFKPLLDLGVRLMVQNPQGTLTIITSTDAVGSEEVNLLLATARAQSIKDYMVSEGAPPDQLILDPRGEKGASEDDDEATAAQQRRAEFLVENLLE